MHSPPSTRIGPGAIIDGKFRVERVIGVGGMGFVVSARQIGLERRVALKFVRPSRADAEGMARFQREARAVARLRSEHVARVLDVATIGVDTGNLGAGPGAPAVGTPYIVMEYLEGSDLATLLRERGPFAAHDVVDYLLQACEAIAEAHSRGIVHRDLKPENLFLTARVDGRPLVKVLDFGISKLTDAGGGSGDLALTRTADLVGSPNYMSPEQLRAARNVDARTDIWALGVIAYELLGAKLPFRGETIMQLCTLVLEHEPASLVELRPDLPPALVGVILRCLEKDPAARFASIADLAAALEPFGPPAQRGAAERLRRISATPSGSAPPPITSSRPASVHARTDVSWAETERDAFGGNARRRVGPMMVALAALMLLFVIGSVFVIRFVVHAAPTAASATKDPAPVPPRAPGSSGDPQANAGDAGRDARE